MKLMRFLALVGMALILSNCMGQIIDNLTGEDDGVSASEAAATLTVDLTKIDDDGILLIVMPVDAFTGTCVNFDDSTFDIYVNDILVNAAGPELAADHYVSDNQQVATAYEQIEYTVDGVVDGDVVSIEIFTTIGTTSASCTDQTAGTITTTLAGTTSATGDTEAVIVTE